jgi:hypothetical protein
MLNLAYIFTPTTLFTSSKKRCLMPLIPAPILVQTFAIIHTFLNKWEHFNSPLGCKMFSCFFNKKNYVLLISFFFVAASYAQTTTPYAVNSAGNLASIVKYNFEWSVGEATVITTMTNSKLMFTNGLLQYNVENQPQTNIVPSFLPNEVKVGPNPMTDVVEINILHAEKGKHLIELFDNKGNQIRGVQIDYSGMGAYQKWNIGGLPAGQYFINVRQTHWVNGRLVKKGAYQIVKVN